jgi:hypothetical protein
LLQFGLEWSEVSHVLGKGIENWGVGGSSPEIWEVSQKAASQSDLMIVGVSLFDMNEHHLSAFRAAIVPLGQTIRDLWDSGADWQFARRVLGQYPWVYVRRAFPTAGNADAVLVGVRAAIRAKLAGAGAAEDEETAMFLPREPVLQFGKSTARVGDWPAARLVRRLDLLRAENGGKHAFDGPKRLALHRMLLRAAEHGRVIIVVLPVSPPYVDEFVTAAVTSDFDRAISEAGALVPGTVVVRLDRVPGLSTSDHFSDLVHLNSAGREVATMAFLSKLEENSQ